MFQEVATLVWYLWHPILFKIFHICIIIIATLVWFRGHPVLLEIFFTYVWKEHCMMIVLSIWQWVEYSQLKRLLFANDRCTRNMCMSKQLFHCVGPVFNWMIALYDIRRFAHGCVQVFNVFCVYIFFVFAIFFFVFTKITWCQVPGCL